MQSSVIYPATYLKELVKTAQNIVNTLGENAINDILNDASVLEKVPSLPKRNKSKLLNKSHLIKNQRK